MVRDESNFGGLRVAALESRRADDTARLIERYGGLARVSPSMREVPLDDNPAAVDFAQRLITGQIDVVILMTGVGTRHLVAAVERHVDRQRFLDALSDVVTVARGPKPVAALKDLGLVPTHRAPEPNTWREVLETLDHAVPLANQSVAVQEYGAPNPSLIAGLEARGARVTTVEVYRWDFPLDTGPLEANVRALVDEQVDVLLFTSAHQVENLLAMAARMNLAEALRARFEHVVVASVGPTTSEMLRRRGLPVDFEPSHPKLGHLISELASRAADLLSRKQRVASLRAARPEPPLHEAPPAGPHPQAAGPGSVGSPLERSLAEGSPAEGSPAEGSPAGLPPAGLSPGGPRAAWYDSPFMKACRREPCDRVPIWLMRQAGRYLSEYRAIRAKTTFLELCRNPALCAEVMITAVERLGVDAAIIFSDLLPILEPMGLELEFAHGEGPVIHNPVREADDVERVIELESVEALDFVTETVRLTRAALAPALPLIGFAGAPFTLASYAIEGGASRNYLFTKTLMYRDEGAFHELMSRLARAVTRYLNAQIAAGAQAVQLFDSWVGCLGPADYRRYVLPHTASIIRGLVAGVPVINFATGNPALLPLLAEAGGEVIGVDWRIGLDQAWSMVGHDRGVQGNLDPLVLLADRATIRRRAQAVLDEAAGRPGHIFNLGHGVLPQTPVDHAIALVEAVHELGPSR